MFCGVFNTNSPFQTHQPCLSGQAPAVLDLPTKILLISLPAYIFRASIITLNLPLSSQTTKRISLPIFEPFLGPTRRNTVVARELCITLNLPLSRWTTKTLFSPFLGRPNSPKFSSLSVHYNPRLPLSRRTTQILFLPFLGRLYPPKFSSLSIHYNPQPPS